MGHRANYAILENGQVDLFYSHWGALTIAEDVFWGPARTESFIRQNDRTDEWLDSVWGEGAVAFDKDHRRLTYYHHQWPDEEDMRRVFEALISETWGAQGWTARRVKEWGDIAEAVGVSREFVTAEPIAPPVMEVDKLGENLRGFTCFGVLSVKRESGWEDRAIDFSLQMVLMNGPTLLGQLANVADLSKLREAFSIRPADDWAKTLGDWINEYCAINTDTKSLRISLPEYERLDISFIQAVWPDWSVELASGGGAAEHFQFTEREVPPDLVPSPKSPEPPPPNRSFEECSRLIHENLAACEERKNNLHQGHIKLIEQITAESGPPQAIAPGFLKRIPSSEPTLLDRIKLGLRLALRRR